MNSALQVWKRWLVIVLIVGIFGALGYTSIRVGKLHNAVTTIEEDIERMKGELWDAFSTAQTNKTTIDVLYIWAQEIGDYLDSLGPKIK